MPHNALYVCSGFVLGFLAACATKLALDILFLSLAVFIVMKVKEYVR